MSLEDKLKYNYHSHTYRCGHASNVPDNLYIQQAIEHGYTKYGVSDHVPVHPIFYGDSFVRMHDNSVEEYLDTINDLKELYSGAIDVIVGFEAEYDEIIEKYLCSLKDKSDYMILGQHYVLNKNIRSTPGYPIAYAEKVCAAIRSGIFDIVAHPDVFMQYRKSNQLQDIGYQEIFEANALVASRMICETAKEYGVPLELNLGATFVENGLIKDRYYDQQQKIINSLSEEQLGDYYASIARYPTRLFWDIVSEVGNDVVVGIDAHYSDDIELRDKRIEKISKYINLDKLNILDDSYDPVSSRKNNQKLQNAYKKTKKQLTSVEGRLIDSYVDEFITDSHKVDKYKTRTDIIRKLRQVPVRRENEEFIYFGILSNLDTITYDRREELINVIKDSVESMSRFNKISEDKFRKRLKKDIDKYYDVCEKELDLNGKNK